MSEQSIWKMLHLLRLYSRPHATGGRTLSEAEITAAGVRCIPDTIVPVTSSGAVEAVGSGHYRLSTSARFILDQCVVASKRWAARDELQVDVPRVFVVMPFTQPWSNRVWRQIMIPAIRQAGLVPIRGDTPIRVTDLTNTVWDSILGAGLVIADLSAPNVNVFYELGLAHALGKDVFILKQHDVQLSADFRRAHVYTYSLDRIAQGQRELKKNLAHWARINHVAAVAALAKSPSRRRTT